MVHVNPAKIPYSLIGIQKLWSNRLNLIVNCFTHSSVISLPAQNSQFSNVLNSFKANQNVPTLKLTIIWKDISNTVLVCAPGTFIPIPGEANILRYLMRIGPSEFGYGNDASNLRQNLEIDSVLDVVHEISLTTSKDHRAAVFKRLSQRLGTKTSFGIGSTNICDIAVLSVVKQTIRNDKDLPANVKVWFDRNQTLFNV